MPREQGPKGRRLVAVVELTARPPFTGQRYKRPASPDSDTQTEASSPVTSPGKRRKLQDVIVNSGDMVSCVRFIYLPA